jgi:membrane fusion protein (multidrug efflux system)
MALTKKKIRIIGVLAILLAGAGIYMLLHWGEISTDDAAFDSTVVTISPKVQGYVTMLNVTDNQTVKAGDVLVEIDPTDYRIALDKADAILAAAKANLQAAGQNLQSTQISAPSNTEAAQAQVESAQADLDNAGLNLKRQQSLSNEARSRQQLENAQDSYKRAQSALNDAKAKLRSSQTAPQTVAAAQATAQQLAAVVQEAQADVAQAQDNLSNTKVTAPIAGRISNRTVNKGDYLEPGQELMSLVGTDYYIIANFKETQLKSMRIGQPVTIDVDAYPKLDLAGRIDSIQSGAGAAFSAFPSQNATGNFVKIVQRVPVKITLDHTLDSHYVVGPGMSVEPTVHTR